ncbi:MAG: nitrous oxide reductase family maturation protein NosD [Candidatus Dadabacteria bacterium]|nr:nitrous oxide reductase family maturation protein NosD [Candidatus Dadabacteria bacterium]
MARIKTKKIILIASLILLIGFQVKSLANEIIVGKESSYSSISEALESSSEGDTIFVKGGIYKEKIVINKGVHLIGEENPVIEGDYSGDVVRIEADKAGIKGFTIRKSGGDLLKDESGIKVVNSEGVRIEENQLDDNIIGVYLYSSPSNTIRNNTSYGRADYTTEETNGNGIHLWKSPNNTLEGNQIRKHRDGIYIEFSPGNLIRNNHCERNVRYGLHYMYSDNNEFEGNIFERNGTGSALMYSKNIVLKKNTFKDNIGPNGFGMLLKSLSDSIAEENIIANNTVGIFMDEANRNQFTRNVFSQNGWAIDLFSSSSENVLYANNFLDNTYQVMTDTERTTNMFFKDSKGNYWDDYSGYNGYDLDGDRIGDIPYKPVRIFSYLMKRYPDLTVFLESPGLKALEFAERVLPVLNPVELSDPYPLMNPVRIEEDSK